jgi:hypothetical protein
MAQSIPNGTIAWLFLVPAVLELALCLLLFCIPMDCIPMDRKITLGRADELFRGHVDALKASSQVPSTGVALGSFLR